MFSAARIGTAAVNGCRSKALAEGMERQWNPDKDEFFAFYKNAKSRPKKKKLQ